MTNNDLQETSNTGTGDETGLADSSLSRRPVPVDAGHVIPLAQTRDGEQLVWDLRKGGLVISGSTGSGASVTAAGIVAECAYRGFETLICDPKGIDYISWVGWPNVTAVAGSSAVEQIAVIHDAQLEMARRFDQVQAGSRAAVDRFEPLILVVDEFEELKAGITRWYAEVRTPGMPTSCPVLGWLHSIAVQGAAVGVLLVLRQQQGGFDIGAIDVVASRVQMGQLSPWKSELFWGSRADDAADVAVPETRGWGVGETRSGQVKPGLFYWTPNPYETARKGSAADRAFLFSLIPPVTQHGPKQSGLFDLVSSSPDWEAVEAFRLVSGPLDEKTVELSDH